MSSSCRIYLILSVEVINPVPYSTKLFFPCGWEMADVLLKTLEVHDTGFMSNLHAISLTAGRCRVLKRRAVASSNVHVDVRFSWSGWHLWGRVRDGTLTPSKRHTGLRLRWFPDLVSHQFRDHGLFVTDDVLERSYTFPVSPAYQTFSWSDNILWLNLSWTDGNAKHGR